jgi:hypothetical protein
VQFRDTELHAARDGVVECLAGTAYDDQIAEPLIEDELDRDPGVDTPEHGRERMLRLAHRDPPRDPFVEFLVPARDEARIALQEPPSAWLPSTTADGVDGDAAGAGPVVGGNVPPGVCSAAGVTSGEASSAQPVGTAPVASRREQAQDPATR